MSEQSQVACFSLTQAEYAAGNFKNQVLESGSAAQIRVNSKVDNVAGVKLPVFVPYETGVEESLNLGLGGGGRRIAQSKQKYVNYARVLLYV